MLDRLFGKNKKGFSSQEAAFDSFGKLAQELGAKRERRRIVEIIKEKYRRHAFLVEDYRRGGGDDNKKYLELYALEILDELVDQIEVGNV